MSKFNYKDTVDIELVIAHLETLQEDVNRRINGIVSTLKLIDESKDDEV